MVTGSPAHPGPMHDDPVYMAMMGIQVPAWHWAAPPLQQAVTPATHAPPLAVHAAALEAHVPPERTPEQHCAALGDGKPFGRHAPFGGVAEAQAINSCPCAHAAPL
jgi:hypothetical protein